jgi:hypothetical protein
MRAGIRPGLVMVPTFTCTAALTCYSGTETEDDDLAEGTATFKGLVGHPTARAWSRDPAVR